MCRETTKNSAVLWVSNSGKSQGVVGWLLEHGERGSLGEAVTFYESTVTLHKYSDLILQAPSETSMISLTLLQSWCTQTTPSLSGNHLQTFVSLIPRLTGAALLQVLDYLGSGQLRRLLIWEPPAERPN